MQSCIISPDRLLETLEIVLAAPAHNLPEPNLVFASADTCGRSCRCGIEIPLHRGLDRAPQREFFQFPNVPIGKILF